MESQIKEEIRLGRYIVTDKRPLIISALGAIPKPGSEEIRLIHDCSRPQGQSVNHYANPDKFHFDSIDKAIKCVTPNSWMAKVDIKAAYRHVGLHPSQFNISGLKYRFTGDKDYTLMYDTRLMFGAAESVGCFHRISQSICRMVRKRAKRLNCHIFCYLDDFLVVGDSQQACQKAVDILINILSDLGFTINWGKYNAPTQEITFLGIQISAISGTLSIPHAKMHEITECASAWQTKQKASKKELQSLIGKMSWAAKCAKAVRPALRSIIRLQSGLKKASHRIRIPKAIKQDLSYFCIWCARFNGVTFIPRTQPVATVYTDASSTAGAAYHQGDFAYMAWSADLPKINAASIYVKELCAVLLAVLRWSNLWSHKSIHLFTDNKATAFALSSGRTKCPIANEVLRDILWLLAINNVTMTVSYITSKDNYIADALSRMDSTAYLTLAIKLLSGQGINIAHPSYNLMAHMSYNSLRFLFGRGASGRS